MREIFYNKGKFLNKDISADHFGDGESIMKTRTMLMIAAAAFAIIPMMVYSVTINMLVGQNGTKEFERQMTDLVRNQSSALTTFIDTAHSQLDTLASMGEISDSAKSGKTSDTASAILNGITNEDESLSAARIITSDGKIIAGIDTGTVLEGFDSYAAYSDDVLYINDVGHAEKTGSVSGSTMFIKKTIGDSTLMLSYDISSYVFISKLTYNSTFYNQGRVIIIDPKGNWTSGAGYNNNLKTLYPASVTDRLSSLEDGVPTEIIRYSADDGAIIGVTYIASMVRAGGENGLVALASCPANRSTIFSSVTSSKIITVAVILSVAAIACAIVAAMLITRPLKGIVETLVKIIRGDHEARISTVSNNEYGQISRAFNNLVDEIVVSEDRYRTIIEMSDNIIFEWNFKTNEVFFSNNFNKKFSYRAPSDHFGDSFLFKAKLHPDDADRYRDDLNMLEKGKNFERNEYRIKNIYGDFIWVLMRTATLRDKDDKPLKVVGVMVDIDRAKKSEQQLTARASYDALTELFNRETIESQIDNEIALSEARKSEMAVLFIDVDDFKHYNDNYSHATGDQVLKFVARTLQGVVEEYGFAGRYGGDEFIACVRNAEINDPSDTAKEIISRLEAGFDSDVGERLTVSVSIGIAVIKDDYNTRVEYLIGRADDAMYSVKKSGKSNFAFIS